MDVLIHLFEKKVTRIFLKVGLETRPDPDRPGPCSEFWVLSRGGYCFGGLLFDWLGLIAHLILCTVFAASLGNVVVDAKIMKGNSSRGNLSLFFVAFFCFFGGQASLLTSPYLGFLNFFNFLQKRFHLVFFKAALFFFQFSLRSFFFLLRRILILLPQFPC